MIPLRASQERRHFPITNWILIAFCGIGFALEFRAGPDLDALIHSYGLIPARFVGLVERGAWLDAGAWLPMVSSAFLHGGVAHFGLNMLFLWVFGAGVEDRLGHLRYGAFYLAGAVVAGLAQIASDPGSTTAVVGASGAIAAVMGGYLLLHPGAWVTSFIVPLFWLQFRVPAFVYLVLWFGLQVWLGTAPEQPLGEGVAWWAHIGGFVFGAAAIAFVGRTRRERSAA